MNTNRAIIALFVQATFLWLHRNGRKIPLRGAANSLKWPANRATKLKPKQPNAWRNQVGSV